MHPDHEPDSEEAYDCLQCHEEAHEAFAAKLREMRASRSIPGYVGPRAGKDKQ